MRTPRHVLLAVLLALPLACAAAAAPVEVNIRWQYRDFGAMVEIYEVEGNRHLWETRSVAGMDEVPAGERIEGSSFTMEPGRRKRFLLVIRNESAATLYFFAAPHVVDPPEYALGFGIRCLCIDHAFDVGPGEVWYRVVQLRLSPDFDGDRLTVTHTIVGIDARRAELFTGPPVEPDQ